MSIGKRISEGLEKINKKDYEGALLPVCVAVAATANREYATINADNEKYKRFLCDNRDIITLTCIGDVKEGINLKLEDCSIKKPVVPEHATLEELLYHVVRCNMVHDAKLGDRVILKEGNEFALLDNTILLPAEVIMGMVFAVVGSGCNLRESLETKYRCVFGAEEVDIDILWGRKEEIMRLLYNTPYKRLW